MIEIARGRLPGADLRVGAMERLPWADDGFDLVTGFNAFQFAADFGSALAEARRVTRPGGQVAICNWGRAEDRELSAVLGPLRELLPPGPPSPPGPAVGEPGVLEELARAAGLSPVSRRRRRRAVRGCPTRRRSSARCSWTPASSAWTTTPARQRRAP